MCRPSKTDNFSFAKSANKQPTQAAISVQARNKEFRGGHSAGASNAQGARNKDAPATGGAGSSDEEDADLASERVFPSPPNNSRSQPISSFTSLKLIQPRQQFGMHRVRSSPHLWRHVLTTDI